MHNNGLAVQLHELLGNRAVHAGTIAAANNYNVAFMYRFRHLETGKSEKKQNDAFTLFFKTLQISAKYLFLKHFGKDFF